MKKVAIVGFGFMGRTHYGAWKKCRGAKVTAVCDVNLSQFTAKVQGNIAGVADNSSLPRTVKVWDDFSEMLLARDVDIVDITLPTPLHADMAVAALEAGCHVLCEKPMSLDLKSCDRMLAAAEKAGRKLLIAHCVRFFPEYSYLGKLVSSGKYGRVVAADFTRCMAAPKWSPNGGSWFLDESKSGGLYLDTHIHDTDYILSLFGRPLSVTSKWRRSGPGYIDCSTTFYDYPGMLVTSSCSFAASASFVWDASARVLFEKATVLLGSKCKDPITVYPEKGSPFVPELSPKSGYEAEVAYFLDMIEGRVKGAPALTACDAREAVEVVIAERKSAASGRTVKLRSPGVL